MADIIVDRTDRGMGTGLMLGLVIAGLAVVIGMFFALGGPARFMAGAPAPSQTNVNVPAQGQPQAAPLINIPKQIDVNVNQQPAAAPQAPAAPAQAPVDQAPVQPVAPR